VDFLKLKGALSVDPAANPENSSIGCTMTQQTEDHMRQSIYRRIDNQLG
jgi:hypothetical protein